MCYKWVKFATVYSFVSLPSIDPKVLSCIYNRVYSDIVVFIKSSVSQIKELFSLKL